MSSLLLESKAQDIGPIGVSITNKQNFITKNIEILEKRKKELLELQKNKNPDEKIAKRMKRLEQLIIDSQDCIKRTKAAMCLGRPYGM